MPLDLEALFGGGPAWTREGLSVDDRLTEYARGAFRVFRGGCSSPSVVSTDVAYAVGAFAAREGIAAKRVKSWLQAAYGAVWVRESNLVPGLDLKEVQAAIRHAMELRGAW